MMAVKFDAWLRELDEDVIQGEHGYEDGEFTVYPEHWRSMFREGLTPAEAFKRAMDAFVEARAEARKADERLCAENWARIQAAGTGQLKHRPSRLTAAQRAALEHIRREGPGALPDTKSGRVPAAVDQLVQAGLLETLNRLWPGPAMYEITPAGRAALDHL